MLPKTSFYISYSFALLTAGVWKILNGKSSFVACHTVENKCGGCPSFFTQFIVAITMDYTSKSLMRLESTEMDTGVSSAKAFPCYKGRSVQLEPREENATEEEDQNSKPRLPAKLRFKHQTQQPTSVQNIAFNLNFLQIDHQKVYLEIIEPPATNKMRFRYECEGRSAGAIQGASSTPENRTYPSIKLVGFKVNRCPKFGWLSTHVQLWIIRMELLF